MRHSRYPQGSDSSREGQALAASKAKCPRGVPAPRHSPEWCLPALVPKASCQKPGWCQATGRGGSAMVVHSTAKILWSHMAGHTQVLGWPYSMEWFLWARSRVLVPGPQCWGSSPSQGWGLCRAPEQPTLLLQLRGASRSNSPWWSCPSPAIPAGRGCCKTVCIVCLIYLNPAASPPPRDLAQPTAAHRYEHP